MAWSITDGELTLDLPVPPNTRAVQECIERAGLDDDEAKRLLDAVVAL